MTTPSSNISAPTFREMDLNTRQAMAHKWEMWMEERTRLELMRCIRNDPSVDSSATSDEEDATGIINASADPTDSDVGYDVPVSGWYRYLCGKTSDDTLREIAREAGTTITGRCNVLKMDEGAMEVLRDSKAGQLRHAFDSEGRLSVSEINTLIKEFTKDITAQWSARASIKAAKTGRKRTTKQSSHTCAVL